MDRLHKTKNSVSSTLDGAITDSATSLDVAAGTGTEFPSTPFWALIDSEEIEVTAVSTDTFTIVRGANSTSASAHYDEATIQVVNTSLKMDELDDTLTYLGAFLAYFAGGGDGVLRNQLNGLEVVAQGTPDMTVQVSTGAAFVNLTPVKLTAASDTSAITAPVSNPRIDVVQINQYDEVSIVTGVEAGSPSAPAVTANNLKLAEIYCRTTMTSIKDTDDSTNGYITDARVYV